MLTLEDGTEIWYAHQSSISVSVGQKVNTGDVIGRVGSTGNSTGAHLHLEVHPDGSSSGVDPLAWLRDKGLSPLRPRRSLNPGSPDGDPPDVRAAGPVTQER
ncbi:hypothetical protein GCM10019016_072010 [Streptomyces prasinosporus]|uniref:M23ase beta-sheet core domain-containing protein n=1 Tax=Streptomyces prasinosporus TaxID=68256 RepID=A0ABP6U1C2_9ACTN